MSLSWNRVHHYAVKTDNVMGQKPDPSQVSLTLSLSSCLPRNNQREEISFRKRWTGEDFANAKHGPVRTLGLPLSSGMGRRNLNGSQPIERRKPRSSGPRKEAAEDVISLVRPWEREWRGQNGKRSPAQARNKVCLRPFRVFNGRHRWVSLAPVCSPRLIW
jgi:hypothetical protein